MKTSKGLTRNDAIVEDSPYWHEQQLPVPRTGATPVGIHLRSMCIIVFRL